MKAKYLIAGFLGFAILILCLRPVPIPQEQDCLSLKGTVTAIYEDGVKDVVFKIHGRKQAFYINRGLERGLVITALKRELIGREVVIKYPNHWTPLDPYNSIVHISKIEHAGRTLFTELD
ncbi:hypothetical protein GZH53_04725 [Flavihumibacter sp. R14]|nr:hypothetical protein [Flavihumibacter soli]